MQTFTSKMGWSCIRAIIQNYGFRWWSKISCDFWILFFGSWFLRRKGPQPRASRSAAVCVGGPQPFDYKADRSLFPGARSAGKVEKRARDERRARSGFESLEQCQEGWRWKVRASDKHFARLWIQNLAGFVRAGLPAAMLWCKVFTSSIHVIQSGHARFVPIIHPRYESFLQGWQWPYLAFTSLEPVWLANLPLRDRKISRHWVDANPLP